MTRRSSLYRWDEQPLDKVTEMVTRKVIATTHSSIVEAYFKKGAVVPIHAHPGEISLYVLQGALRARVDGEETTVREGEVLVIPAGAQHQIESLDDTFVITFSPAGL